MVEDLNCCNKIKILPSIVLKTGVTINLKNVVGELSQKMLLNCPKIYVRELFSRFP